MLERESPAISGEHREPRLVRCH